jgi:predicted proteasome-type protease
MLTIISAKWLGNLGVTTRGTRIIRGRACVESQIAFQPMLVNGFVKRRIIIIINRPEIATSSAVLSVLKADLNLEDTQNIFGWPTNRTFSLVDYDRPFNENRII